MSERFAEPWGAPPGPAEVSAPDVDLHKVWGAVATEMWRRRPGALERAAARALRSPGLARALLTTPSLLAPWLIASVVVLGAGAAATAGTHQPLVALLAPALAGAGIAYAYGPGVEPAWELSASMAVSNRMVLLVRALAVFAVDAALGVCASLASGTASGLTFSWLVPMTAVSAFALAVATLARSANVGVASGLAGWAITVLSSQAAESHFRAAIDASDLVAPYLVFALLCVAVTFYGTRTARGAS